MWRVRSVDCGLRMIIGSEAFAGTIAERPTGRHVVGRACVAALLRVQKPREAARRIVTHDDPGVVAEPAKRPRLVVSVLLDATQKDHE